MVREDIKEFLKTIKPGVCVVAATKYTDASGIKELYEAGLRDFGENRVDAFLEKYEELSDYDDIRWHFIGHLQRNKCMKVIDKIDYLHSLDSIELAKMIDSKRSTPLKVFVEVSINNEESKDGVLCDYIYGFMEEILKLKNIEVVGLMMMTIKNSTKASLKYQFDTLVELQDDLRREFDIALPYLSMGMSDDYVEAIEAGSTHVRLGRILWKN